MQQYYWKVFRWENGAKGEDLTDYVVAPIFLEDKLDETLDTGEIILKRMPISTKEAFPPKTKFRLECYLDEEHTRLLDKWDMVVEHDDVEEYVGCPDICTHRVHLIEASVVAQGMHVDNIALTYELQDVDLNYKIVVSIGTTIGDVGGCDYQNSAQPTPIKQDKIDNRDVSTAGGGTNYERRGTFENTYKYDWDRDSFANIKGLMINHHALNTAEIKFNIPKLYAYGATNGGEWTPLFQMNTVTRVKKKLLKNGGIQEESLVTFENGTTEIHSGPKEIAGRNDSYGYCVNGNAFLRKIRDIEIHKTLLDAVNADHSDVVDSFEKLYETFPPVAKAGNYKQECSFKTDVLTQPQLDEGYSIDYEIICCADKDFYNGMISHYKQTYYAEYIPASATFWGFDARYDVFSRTEDLSNEPSPVSILVSNKNANIHCGDLAEKRDTPFLKKGRKYSCYDLFRKAMLTCDTQLIDNNKVCLDEWGIRDDGSIGEVPSIEYPIVVSNSAGENWEARMKAAKMYETVVEQKNMWEVLIQIGYYLHAIPYLEFAKGTDRFVLKFHQLGDTKQKRDSNNKITVFNSRNLSDYFTQYDSYVTNIFSPQNEVEEWVTPKTSDSSYLVSNNTAELQLKYPITEIVAFDIIYNGEQKSVISNIFESSIYQILTNADPAQIIPAKGNSLYYTLGSNKIQGLSYVAPSKNNDKLMALKYIIQRSFGISGKDIKFNDVRFHVRYKTQDTLRMTQVRPNLLDFVKNSSYEKYPHHEQFYGQQDKIVDSERFSANLFGKLIRVGNAVYQRQEAVTEPSERKQSGDLVMLGTEPYYVTEVENECYADLMLQKVMYSKNFNQLSNIVTIPSEPRFYEVSERSKIRREVRIMEFFELSTKEPDQENVDPVFMSSDWKNFIRDLIFYKNRTLPNFAWTRFMADRKRQHTGINSSYATWEVLFPSSDFDKVGENTIMPKISSGHSDCIVPLLHYPLHDGIVFEWDMEDNFKAGDFIDDKIQGEPKDDSGEESLPAADIGDSVATVDTIDEAYISQQSLRYVDILGRADLFRFNLFNQPRWTADQMRRLPQAVIDPPPDSVIGVQPGAENEIWAIALDKDNREAISFNYQINLLHRSDDYGNDFITFPNLFGDKEADLKFLFLNKEVSMFDENIDINGANILLEGLPPVFRVSGGRLLISIIDKRSMSPSKFAAIEKQLAAILPDIKSIVLYEDNASGRFAYIAKNVSNVPNDQKLLPWLIYPIVATGTSE